MIPSDADLDLHIGWDRFEKLMLAVSQRVVGLQGIRFRRYGVRGQAQHGIDLAGREPDGRYTVVQCKDYEVFTANDLRVAVDKFATGRRPFDAQRLIVATSATTGKTQVAEELRVLQDEHPDLSLDLWGSEQINESLRGQGDVVARFWTQETAKMFCTGAPQQGVPVPLPDRQKQADKILVGPLRMDDVSPLLQQADDQRGTDPEGSARLYGQIADELHGAGFRGHALTLRGKQLEALAEAARVEQAVGLAAHLAVTALHFGDRDEARHLAFRIKRLSSDASASGEPQQSSMQSHARLVRAAVDSVLHPLGDYATLREALETPPEEELEPAYWPLLVLLLSEHVLASDPKRLDELGALIDAALANANSSLIAGIAQDTTIRLRLVRAEYDKAERVQLNQSARLHLVSGRHSALIRAREARRCALEGDPEDAVAGWREAVYEAIHAGLVQDAADWLYAIRAVNARYGPFKADLDDEHRLAQALRATGNGRLLDRARSPQESALSAKVREKPIQSVLAAQRWLTDSVITGNWASEFEAAEFLGDLYRDSREPSLAAKCYQHAGRAKKLEELARVVGDLPLPLGSLIAGPWWVLHARAALVEAQVDLIHDHEAGALLGEVTDLAERSRAGELLESASRPLTRQATRSACSLIARGTPGQARILFDLLAPDVSRGPNQASYSDDCHAAACLAVADTHPELRMLALTRLFDLADQQADKALSLVASDRVAGLLGTRPGSNDKGKGAVETHSLSDDEVAELRRRVFRLEEQGYYLADVALAAIDPEHPAVRERAEQALNRILQRPAPVPGVADFGTSLIPDSYLASFLHIEDRTSCLNKLMSIAQDDREVADTRKDALTGVRNLVVDAPSDVRQQIFEWTESFVLGLHDGSHLDEEVTGTPHPLSSFKIFGGSASLRGEALLLAVASASSPEESAWARDQAVGMLSSTETVDLQHAAIALSRLPREATASVDANLMATHGHVGVRQASAVLCLRDPARFGDVALRLATDQEHRVRRTLAEAATQAGAEGAGLSRELLDILARDPRHSVRLAASPDTRA